MDDSQTKQLLIEKLRRDAELHERRQYSEVRSDFDEFDATAFRSLDDANFWIAFTFWESWADQCEHGFRQNFYDGIYRDDWPVLAREVASCLESGAEILNPAVLENCGPRTVAPGLFSQLFDRLRRFLR